MDKGLSVLWKLWYFKNRDWQK